MKKIIKALALILSITVIALTLGSCRYLDAAKAHQAFYTDETKREISFEDHIYKIINPGKLSFVFTDTINTTFHATAKDVPVLVSRFEGDYFDLNSEKTIISMFASTQNNWYVRDDWYDKAKDLIENAKLDRYFFGYYDYRETTTIDYEQYLKSINNVAQNNVLLDDDITEIVNKALASSNDKNVDYKDLESGQDAQRYFRLKRCDKDIIITNNDEIYLIRDYDNKYYVWNGDTLNKKTICPIDEEDIPKVKALFKEYPDAYEYGNIREFFEGYYYEYPNEIEKDNAPIAVKEV